MSSGSCRVLGCSWSTGCLVPYPSRGRDRCVRAGPLTDQATVAEFRSPKRSRQYSAWLSSDAFRCKTPRSASSRRNPYNFSPRTFRLASPLISFLIT